MRNYMARKYHTYIVIASLSILACIISGRFEYILLGLPFLISIFLPAFEAHEPEYTLKYELSQDEYFEGGTAHIRVLVCARTALPVLEIRHLVRYGTGAAIENDRILVSMAQGEERTFDFKVRLWGRGVFTVGQIASRVLSWSGLRWSGYHALPGTECLVYPRIYPLRLGRIPAQSFRLYTGSRSSHFRGEGVDIAGVREYIRGDATKQINWRSSLRWNHLYVNERLQERNIDAVIILDTLKDVGERPYTTLDSAARGATSLAFYFLERNDNVGLIEYGGPVDWLAPQSGRRQFYLILERLARLRLSTSFVSKDVRTISKKILPPGALVIVFTSLLDGRSYRMLIDLAARGFILAIIYVSPIALTAHLIGNSQIERLAKRWWDLEQRKKIKSLRELGLVVTEWDGREPLDSCLGEIFDMPLRGYKGNMTLTEIEGLHL